MRPFIVFGLVMIVAIASGCCKKKVYCSPERLKVAFIGFDRGSSRTVILKRYRIGDEVRSKALDSTQFVYNGNTPIVPGKPDTLWFDDYTATTGLLEGIYLGNNWQIYMPAPNRRLYISDIVDDGHHSELVKCGDDKTTCTKGTNRFSLDFKTWWGNTLYINR